MTTTEKWLVTPLSGNTHPSYSRTAVGEDAAIELLHNALALVEKRNRDLAAAGQRDWTGTRVQLVIDGAPELFKTTDVRRTLTHIARYGRKAGVEVAAPDGVTP